jgi:hypothetical protein
VYEPFFSAGFARCGYQYAGVRCQVAFSRDNGMMSGSVAGPFFVVDNKSGVCARAVVTFRTEENVVLSTRDRETCAESFLAESYDSGSLARIRVHVGEVDDFADAQLKTYSFNGNTGNFLAESGNPRVAVHERVNYVFNWTVPEPLNWHDLASVELRIRDEEETILHVRFDEATGSFSVFNEASERFGNAFAAGSQVRLQSRHAVLHLDGTSVSAVNSLLGNGPASPTVRLNLGLSFKPSAAGRTFNVYVAASDDSGDEDPFALAGTLTVED